MGLAEIVEPSEIEADGDVVEARVLRAGIWLAVAAVAVQTVLHLANLVLFGSRFTILDVESDVSLWAWASTAAEAAAAATAALLAILPRRIAWRLVLLAALLAFLSADDILTLHERISVEQLGPIPQLHQCGHEWFHIDLEQARAKARFQSARRSFRQQAPTFDKAHFRAAFHLVHVMRSNKDRFSLVTQIVEQASGRPAGR